VVAVAPVDAGGANPMIVAFADMINDGVVATIDFVVAIVDGAVATIDAAPVTMPIAVKITRRDAAIIVVERSANGYEVALPFELTLLCFLPWVRVRLTCTI
jgi:hypothetical protein